MSDIDPKKANAFMDLVAGREATALYRTLSFVLLLLITVAGWIAQDKLGDLKSVTVAVQAIERRMAEIDGSLKVGTTKTDDHERRIGKLEDWRNTFSNTRGNP